MQRLHSGLCQHFNQDPYLPITVYVGGFDDHLSVSSVGDVVINGVGKVSVDRLKRRYLNNSNSSTEELLTWIEKTAYIIIRINNDPAIFNEQGSML